MKKLLLYYLIFVFLCFAIPILFTTTRIASASKEVSSGDEAGENGALEKTNTQEGDTQGNTQEEDVQANTQEGDAQGNTQEGTAAVNTQGGYNYEKYATIKLFHTKTGQVEEMPIDEYLYGVVSAEMPASYEIEALKAQGIVARSYTIYQITHNGVKHEGADICDNYACCQAWISKADRQASWQESERESNWNKIIQAVNATSGKVITYAGNIINAFFHSNSGGVTESSVNIWGGVDYPYLKSVETSGEDGYSQYSSEVTLSQEELLSKIKAKHADVQINFADENSIKILEYTESKRVKTIQFGNISMAGTEARTLLGLRSTNFTIQRQDKNIIFSVVGYGHGVGMSQTGADSMAKNGSSFEEIVKHFYTGVEISEINNV